MTIKDKAMVFDVIQRGNPPLNAFPWVYDSNDVQSTFAIGDGNMREESAGLQSSESIDSAIDTSPNFWASAVREESEESFESPSLDRDDVSITRDEPEFDGGLAPLLGVIRAFFATTFTVNPVPEKVDSDLEGGETTEIVDTVKPSLDRKPLLINTANIPPSRPFFHNATPLVDFPPPPEGPEPDPPSLPEPIPRREDS